MNSKDYKNTLKGKDILDYGTLESTLAELVEKEDFELAQKIKLILEKNQIEKPELHSKLNDSTSNYYKVDLDSAVIDNIIQMLIDLEASFVGEDGNTTPKASYYASLVNNWHKLIEDNFE